MEADSITEHYKTQLRTRGSDMCYSSPSFIDAMKNQTSPFYATTRVATLMRKGWCTIRHSDSLHEHVTITSSQPQRIIIFCTGAGNKPPAPETFPDSIIFCITGGKSFALTGTRGDGDDGERYTICETDSSLISLLKDFWDELNQSGVFSGVLTSETGKHVTVQPPAAHLRPPCRHVVLQLTQQLATFSIG